MSCLAASCLFACDLWFVGLGGLGALNCSDLLCFVCFVSCQLFSCLYVVMVCWLVADFVVWCCLFCY